MNRCTSVSLSPFVVAVNSFPPAQLRRMAASPLSFRSNVLPLNSAALPSSVGLTSPACPPLSTASGSSAVSAHNCQIFQTIVISFSFNLGQVVPEVLPHLQWLGHPPDRLRNMLELPP